MRQLIPPFCFLFAIVMVGVAFCLLAIGSPEVGVELHKARANNDELFKEAFESELRYKQWTHFLLVGGLFAGSFMMIYTGFKVMERRAN